jgi:hypothetical protein
MIMKKTLMLLCLALTVLINGHAFGQTIALPVPFGPHQWTALVKVVGEDGNSITGANIAVSYDIVPPPSDPNQPQYGEIKGVTDTNGMFSASHTDSSLGLAIIVEKSGHYTTHIGYQFYFDEKRQNPTFTLMLKEIGKPIPMYAKHEEAKVQEEDKPIGFDLMAGDWVTPSGKGFHSDLFFTVHRKIINEREYDCALTVTFPNKGDGIAIAPSESVTGSAFRTSRTAAENGYEPELDLHYSNTNQPQGVFGYFIRVHTELNPDGTIKSALYGKIPGNFRFYAGTKVPRAGMGFDYYLNPTPNDRNVEFNPTKNLVKDIGEFEAIKEP